MHRFRTAKASASCTGLVPGKKENAERNRSSRTSNANRYLKSALAKRHMRLDAANITTCQPSIAVSLSAGKKRSAVAVAHSILVIVYHIIKCGTACVDLGSNYFDKQKQETIHKRLIRRLEQLGLKVSVELLKGEDYYP